MSRGAWARLTRRDARSRPSPARRVSRASRLPIPTLKVLQSRSARRSTRAFHSSAARVNSRATPVTHRRRWWTPTTSSRRRSPRFKPRLRRRMHSRPSTTLEPRKTLRMIHRLRGSTRRLRPPRLPPPRVTSPTRCSRAGDSSVASRTLRRVRSSARRGQGSAPASTALAISTPNSPRNFS